MPSNLNPQLAQLIAENASASSTAGTLTGEPCRCPEWVLDCLCGAYTTEDNL